MWSDMVAPLLAPLKVGIPFVFSGPAGSGKTTLAKRLIAEFPTVVTSVSYTTRSPRSDEVDGRDYLFVKEEKFKERIAAGDLLEYVQLYGHYYYGTSRHWVEEQRGKGYHVFLVIDTQGAKALRDTFPHTSIFVAPPSLEELGKRLRERQTESSEKIAKRLAWAETEMQVRFDYDYVLVNDDLDTAYQVLRSIVIAETHRSYWLNK